MEEIRGSRTYVKNERIDLILVQGNGENSNKLRSALSRDQSHAKMSA
jgi:hypothetical protein